jgi:hypothetical protein
MSRTLAFNPATRFASFFTHRAAWVENLITRISQPYILDDSTLEALERLLAKKTLNSGIGFNGYTHLRGDWRYF